MLPLSPLVRVLVSPAASASQPQTFDTGLLLIKDANFTAARRLTACSSQAAALQTLSDFGFSDSTDAAACVRGYFGASPAPARLLLSCYAASEALPEALAAVLSLSGDFYGIALAQAESDTRVLALADALEASEQPLMLFLPLIGKVSAVTGASALLHALHDRGARRTVPFFCAQVADAAALMGTAMGLQLAHPASAFSLCYKALPGVTPSDLSEADAEKIRALSGNVYLTRGYTRRLLERGTVASGLRYDEVLYPDMIAADLQAAALSLLADNPDRLPQTDDATARFINRFSAILSAYTARGVLAPGPWRGADTGPLAYGDPVENGFLLWADRYDDQLEADRQAHQAVPIHVALLLAGSVESLVISVHVVY